jgi:predicted O-linked N-acetylglucosamine transferase (SPINDLY family)
MTVAVQIGASKFKIKDPKIVKLHDRIGEIMSLQSSFKFKKKEILKMIANDPLCSFIYYCMGLLYQEERKFDKALLYYKYSISIDDFVDAYLNVACIYQQCGLFNVVENYMKIAIQKHPKDARVANLMGTINHLLGKHEAALPYYESAATLCTDDVHLLKGICSNIGFIYSGFGKEEIALQYFDKGLALKRPSEEPVDQFIKIDMQLLSNKLLSFDYMAEIPKDSYKSYLQINKILPHQKHYKFKRNTGKLHVGIVSPDFRKHAVAFFLENILKYYDRDLIEIYCYSNSNANDSMTEKIRGSVKRFVDITRQSDEQVADMIFGDKIDLLIDLAGHTNNNRLGVFGLKPAPVQVTYLGFPNTTGLKTIDYRITDKFADPVDTTQFYSEKLIRMPNCFINFCCPVDEKVFQLSKSVNDIIVFGVLNKIHKHNRKNIEVWGKILQKYPNSKLLIKKELVTSTNLKKDYLNALGISEDRLIIEEFMKDVTDYWRLFNKIDICLDSFPYSGTTTTCNSLWMGIPVITYSIKNRHCQNVSASILKNMGVEDLIAYSEDDYINRAIGLAKDKQRIMNYKQTLREKFIKSMEPIRFVKDFCDLLITTYKNTHF